MMKEIKLINEIIYSIKTHDLDTVYNYQELLISEMIDYYNTISVNNMHSLHTRLVQLEKKNVLTSMDYNIIIAIWYDYKDIILLSRYIKDLHTPNKLLYSVELEKIRDEMQDRFDGKLNNYLIKYVKMNEEHNYK